MASARVALAVRRLAASTKLVGKRHMSGGSYEEEVGARWPCAALRAWSNRGCCRSGACAPAPATPLRRAFVLNACACACQRK